MHHKTSSKCNRNTFVALSYVSFTIARNPNKVLNVICNYYNFIFLSGVFVVLKTAYLFNILHNYLNVKIRDRCKIKVRQHAQRTIEYKVMGKTKRYFSFSRIFCWYFVLQLSYSNDFIYKQKYQTENMS